jgi:hypothetical protein
MSAVAYVPLPVYLWHYVVARLVYDELVRPAIRGSAGPELALGAVLILIAVVVLRRRARSRRA